VVDLVFTTRRCTSRKEQKTILKTTIVYAEEASESKVEAAVAESPNQIKGNSE
jgi:hypothetical protein